MKLKNAPSENIKEVMLPFFICPYCSNKNYGLGSQCSTCPARLTAQDKERMELPGVFTALNLGIPDEMELYERNEKNYGWIDSTGIYNMNLPKNYDGFPEVTSMGSGEIYQEGVHILPMKVLIGFGVDEDGIPGDEGELSRMGEALQLLQFAIVKAMKKDSEQGVSYKFTNCHTLLKRIEKKKKQSGVLRNGLRDVDDLIEFLENYINGISKQSIKNTTKKVRRRSQLALEKTADISQGEWNEWAILGGAGIVGIVAMVGYLALTDKTYIVRVGEMSSITTITVQEKEWLEKNYTIRQYIPEYDGDYVFEPSDSDIEYSEEEYDDADEEFSEFKNIKTKYSPNGHFRLGEEETILGPTISIDTGVIEVIERDCPEPETEEEDAGSDSEIRIPSGGGNDQWDYTPIAPSGESDDGGNGFGFGSGGSINKASYNPFGFLISAAHAQGIEEDCDIENEITLSARIKYDIQNYSYWDFGEERQIRNQEPIIGPTPQAPDFLENDDNIIYHNKTHISYFLSLYQGDTRRLLNIPNYEDWNNLSTLGVCEITTSQLRYLLSGTTQADLETCI